MADDHRQWGDFQTPTQLAGEICAFLAARGLRPDTILEPTCGQGNFLLAALEHFPTANLLYGVEVQPEYVHKARQRVDAARAPGRPNAQVHEGDIFRYEFPKELSTSNELLILGNPPWVTNSELSVLASQNVPRKANTEGRSGMDAMTGKSNFDISEAIIWRLLELFHHCHGYVALLCKNSVIRKVLEQLPRRNYKAGSLRAYALNSQRLFGARVEASLLLIQLGSDSPQFTCDVYDWNHRHEKKLSFGWHTGRFVSNVETYEGVRQVDGGSPREWRQGIKHDCAKVMELVEKDGCLANLSGSPVLVERGAVLPYLKSSDLRGFSVRKSRRWLPVTQRRLGEDTSWIQGEFPLLWAYLNQNRAAFEKRKSGIYRGKPLYSVFGVGDYSFAPYKVAISGMYKHGSFTLVTPIDGAPVLLDDTVYFLAFDTYEDALFSCSLLNSSLVKRFLGASVFLDAKRPFTKEVLMRIDLPRVARSLPFEEVERVWSAAGYAPEAPIYSGDYADFVGRLESRK